MATKPQLLVLSKNVETLDTDQLWRDVTQKIHVMPDYKKIDFLLNALQNSYNHLDHAQNTMIGVLNNLEDDVLKKDSERLDRNLKTSVEDRDQDIALLRSLHEELSACLLDIGGNSSNVDVASLAKVTNELGAAVNQYEKHHKVYDNAVQTRLRHEKGRATLHRTRAQVLRFERNKYRNLIEHLYKRGDSEIEDISFERRALIMLTNGVREDLRQLREQIAHPTDPFSPNNQNDRRDIHDDKFYKSSISDFLELEALTHELGQLFKHLLKEAHQVNASNAYVPNISQRTASTSTLVGTQPQERSWVAERQASINATKVAQLLGRVSQLESINLQLEQQNSFESVDLFDRLRYSGASVGEAQ